MLTQNKPDVGPALIAPGITSMIALSTTSIRPIESVSDAIASEAAVFSDNPDLNRGKSVSEYPKRKAKNTESATVDQLPHPSAVPMIIPRTSPMAQPDRQ